jgi:GNAT superfamily N-acetyltransferase
MNPDLTVRDYARPDWPEVCRAHDLARPLEFVGCPGFSADHPIRSLAEAAEDDGFFKSRTAVALWQSRVIGFASVHGPYLSFLYVDPGFHRRGAGRALLAYVKPWMGAEGYTTATATNAAALALYRSAGMEVACRFPGEAEGLGGWCVRMAFPTSSHRRRPCRPSVEALRLEAVRRGVPVAALPREWPAEP